MEKLASRWEILFTKLGLEGSKISVINRNYPRDAENCLREALEEWLRTNHNTGKYGKPCWRKLAEAIRSMNYEVYKRIANEHSECVQILTCLVIDLNGPVNSGLVVS